MRDVTLMEPFAAPEYFVDGFAEHQILNGIFTFSAYRRQNSGDSVNIVIARFVMRVPDVVEAHKRTREVLLLTPLGLMSMGSHTAKLLS